MNTGFWALGRSKPDKVFDSSRIPLLAFPTRAQLLDFITKNDGVSNKSEIARAFSLKGPDRTKLRDLLKKMDTDGAIHLEGGKRVKIAGRIAPVMPVDILSVNDDGDLECALIGDDLPESAPLVRIPAKNAAKQRPPVGVGDRVLVRLSAAGDGSYSASVIKRIGKGAHKFLAIYHTNRRGGVAEPVERRAKQSFEISDVDSAGAKDGDLVWVETKNARGYGPRKARVRSIAGHIDDRDAFSLIALASHNIPIEFPTAVLEEAESAKNPTASGRVDLRDSGLLTIDPADAKDHDDAVVAIPDDAKDNEGGFRIIVAIADVSHFVRTDSALDREALKRGNSVYLPDRVVPMLPEILSNGLCSLREGEERPCIAVEMTISAGGVLKSSRFMRAIMKSAAKLSYEDAQAIHDGKLDYPGLKLEIDHLYPAYKARLIERTKRAPLNLDLAERRIVLNDDGTVKAVVRRERFDAHRVIEEFMILANVAAAQTLERARHGCSLPRA